MLDWILRWLPNASPERLAEIERNFQVAAWSFGILAVASTAIAVTVQLLAWHAGKLASETHERDLIAAQEKDRVEVAQTRTEVAQARQEITQTQQRTAELQSKMATRQLTPDQRKILTTILAEGKGTRISILAPMGDAEAGAFRLDLASALREAGWNVKVGANFVATVSAGLYIIVANPKNLRPDQAMLKRAFDEASIQVGLEHNPDAPALLNLRVGPKP